VRVRRSTPSVFEIHHAKSAEAPWGTGFTAREVIEALEPLALERRALRFREVIDERIESVALVMDAPHDPHNGAAILRSCEAFGVQTVHVVEREEPFLVAGKVSKGTERWLDVIRHKTASQAIERLRQDGYQLAVAHPQGALLPEQLGDIPRLALIMGNESDGVCEELTAAAEHTVRVPMRGFVESLNVSVTTALLLSAATARRAGDLPEDRRTKLYARALFQSVPRSSEVLRNLKHR
jgi:tRNA (guanosine-2'-O-)-methyltransferase